MPRVVLAARSVVSECLCVSVLCQVKTCQVKNGAEVPPGQFVHAMPCPTRVTKLLALKARRSAALRSDAYVCLGDFYEQPRTC